jgi:hypothetical protein
MIKKSDTCLYCGEKMESQTAKKKFCSTKCRVYYNRELKVQSVSVIVNKPLENVEKKANKKAHVKTPINLSFLEQRRKNKLK